jgi:hypothetical protein
MSAVVEAISAPFEAIGDAVGAVGDVISDVAQEVGNVVEDTAQAVGATAQAIIEDPTKALPMIAVAVAAPYAAPYLWAGASTAQAAMVLNTGLALAQGADPGKIAQNFAVNMATQGLVNELGITTGTDFVDTGINKAISTAVQTGDINQALASGIVSGATSFGKDAIKDFDFTGGPEELGYTPEQLADITSPATDSLTASQVFKDAIDSGFSPDEAYAIAQGQLDAEQSGVSPYAPTASTDSNVLVTAAPPEFDNAEPLIDPALAEYKDPYLETEESPLDALAEYKDPYAEESPLDALAESKDTYSDTGDGVMTTGTGEDFDMGSVTSQTSDSGGLKTTTFDDGSTIITDANGDVVDFTESTDEDFYTDIYEETPDEASPTGFKFSLPSIKGSLSKAAKHSNARRGTRGTTTAPAGLDATMTGTNYLGSSLTPGVATGNPEFSIFGEVSQGQPDENVSLFATGGSTSTQNQQAVYDLGGDISSQFTGSKDKIMKLVPGVTKAKIDYALPGYPYGKVFKLAEGGNVPGHNPEFYSEGGLNSIGNRYVTGNGDGTSDSIPAMLANGEFVIPADVVSSLGNGSNDSGAKILDQFLNVIRKHKRKADPKKLPPDSKGALSYLSEAKKKVKK